jgi:hypothetical protein
MADFSLGEAVLGTAVDLDGLKSGFGQAASLSKGGVDRLTGVLTAGIGVAVAGAVAGFGVAAFQAGQEMDAAFDTILIKTGATGETLETSKTTSSRSSRQSPPKPNRHRPSLLPSILSWVSQAILLLTWPNRSSRPADCLAVTQPPILSYSLGLLATGVSPTKTRRVPWTSSLPPAGQPASVWTRSWAKWCSSVHR